jgi:phosphate uptake regulator
MNLLDRALLAAQNDDEQSARSLLSEQVQKGGAFDKQAEELVLCVKEHYDSMQQSFHAAMLINALTRISAHVGNICEHIIFSITGEDIRHQDEESD